MVPGEPDVGEPVAALAAGGWAALASKGAGGARVPADRRAAGTAGCGPGRLGLG